MPSEGCDIVFNQADICGFNVIRKRGITRKVADLAL